MSEETHPSIGAAIDAAIGSARRAFPAIRADDATLAEGLRARVAGEADAPAMLAALAALETDEVVLATACALGDPGALAELDARYLPDLRATLGRVGLRGAGIDEAEQLLRVELLVPPAGGGRARIGGYGGQGKLRSWLRAVATRIGIRLRRGESKQGPQAEEAPAIGANDLELAYLKKKYGSVFSEAFQAAFAALPTGDRLLLKQRLAHGMSIADVGALHGVHASTASRWVSDARERLVAATRDEMMQRLRVGRAEVESLLRLIQSEIDITLSTAPELHARVS